VKKTLKNIADLTTGYSFRGRVPIDPDGSVIVIQAKNISDDGSVQTQDLDKVKEADASEVATLESGDVLLVSRGAGTSGFRAAVFEPSIGRAIASATLQVIHVNDERVLPAYLCAYLNSNRGQADLQKIATGSSVRTVSLGELNELKIPVPKLEDQKRLNGLVKTIHKQRELLERKSTLLDQIRRTSTSQIIK